MTNNKDPIKPVRAQGARTTFFPPYALMIGLIASSLLDSFFIHLPLFKGSMIVLIIGLIIAVSSFLMAIYTLKIFSDNEENPCLLYTSPSPRDQRGSRMPSSA